MRLPIEFSQSTAPARPFDPRDLQCLITARRHKTSEDLGAIQDAMLLYGRVTRGENRTKVVQRSGSEISVNQDENVTLML